MTNSRSQVTLFEKVGAGLLTITFAFWSWQAQQVVEESKLQHKDIANLEKHAIHQDDTLDTHGRDIDFLKSKLSNNGRSIVQQPKVQLSQD